MTHPSSDRHATKTSSLEQKVTFFFVCMGVIALTYGFFFVIDFLPETPTSETATNTAVTTQKIDTDSAITDETRLPVRIIIDKLVRNVVVANPESNTVEALDAALLKGIARHPDSADFQQVGTIFLLGHSSYLPNVINKNFQAFNGIQRLTFGDTIRLQSKDTEYVYSVDRVYQAKASAAEVPLQHETAKLILATCNSFGTKDDRFIVEASLIESHPLSTIQ
jgi:LPXTG-site transpeptidase (sortase) family protein